MGTRSGSGNLQYCWYPRCTGCLQVGQCVQHGGRTIEVRGQPVACVIRQEWVQPQIDVPHQMGGDHFRSQRQEVGRAVIGSPAPSTGDSGHPAGLAGSTVLPPHGVHVPPGSEQVGEERHLLARRGARAQQSPAMVGHGCLRGSGRAGLRRGQSEDCLEAGVLGAQTRNLRTQRDQLGLHATGRYPAPEPRMVSPCHHWMAGDKLSL